MGILKSAYFLEMIFQLFETVGNALTGLCRLLEEGVWRQ